MSLMETTTERNLITADLVVRCQNCAKLLPQLHTAMGRATTIRIGDGAATELRRRGVLVPEAWEEVERKLEGI